MRVVVIGAGYVGLTLGTALAYVGHEVIAIDSDPARIAALSRGDVPILEPGLHDMLSDLTGTRIVFTSQKVQAVSNADVIVIAVGTPTGMNGEADTSAVIQAVRELSVGLESGKEYLIVVKSTVPVGTNAQIAFEVRQVLGNRGVNATVHFASNPEFQREGQALHDMLYPDRMVVGADNDAAVAILGRLYRPILEQSFEPPAIFPRPVGYELPPLIITDVPSAELIKYAANAFLALKISFINEVAGLCERVGANVVEVARGIGRDARIGPSFLGAGIGWGGSCFPKDTSALVAMGASSGYTMPIVEAARTVNFRQIPAVVSKIENALGCLTGKTVGVLGLAFKANTDDVREAPAIDLVRMLVQRGVRVRVHDPVAQDNARRVLTDVAVDFCPEPYAVANSADALVLTTEWHEYRSLDLCAIAHSMNCPVLVDGRNFFDPDAARRAGFFYHGVGIGGSQLLTVPQL